MICYIFSLLRFRLIYPWYDVSLSYGSIVLAMSCALNCQVIIFSMPFFWFGFV